MIKGNKNAKNETSLQLPDGQPIPEFYSNAVSVNYSPYEFEFSQMLLDSGGNLKGAINVRLSPQTAKSLMNILNHVNVQQKNREGTVSKKKINPPGWSVEESGNEKADFLKKTVVP